VANKVHSVACILQVFFELLMLIKADKERRQNRLEHGSKAAAAATTTTTVNHGKKSIRSRTSGSVDGGPDAQKRATRGKTIQKKSKSKRSAGGRWRRRRRRVRNFRRAMRRLLGRIAACGVL